jgi:hypothetical protein
MHTPFGNTNNIEGGIMNRSIRSMTFVAPLVAPLSFVRALGSWASGSGTPTAVKIVNAGRSLTLASTIVPAANEGILNADGTEITGTFREGSAEQPMTFRRAVATR